MLANVADNACAHHPKGLEGRSEKLRHPKRGVRESEW
jgi:hypothetical protein